MGLKGNLPGIYNVLFIKIKQQISDKYIYVIYECAMIKGKIKKNNNNNNSLKIDL